MKLVNQSLIAIFVVTVALSAYPLQAESEATTAQNRLQQIALFKNGLGFFVSEVEIPKNKDSFSIVPFGAASHGTFWIAYPAKVKLTSLIARPTDAQLQLPATTIPELLRANLGQRVKLNYAGKDIDGVIKYFAQDRPIVQPSPYAPSRPETPSRDYIRSNLLIIQTETGDVAINPQSVQNVAFLADNAQTSFTSKTKSTLLDVNLKSPAGGNKLTLSYLAKGITWAPSYMVDISDDDQARISAKAAIINDIGDLEDVRIELVTGFPNLQFADITSPLSLKENLAQFLQALTQGQSQRGERRGVMYQQAAMDYNLRRGSVMPDYGSAQAGMVAEDLFFYPLDNVNLRKGQVGYYPLFTESVPYSHIYRWEIPDYVNEQDQYRYDRGRGDQSKDEEEIWHCLKLENSTKIPWTTAPAETLKQGLILGQDTLKYTPSKGQALLRITKAMGVKAQQSELETDRQRGLLKVYGRQYDLVSVQGKLSVQNFQNKAITMEISKTLSGEVISTDPQAKIEKLAKGLRRMNSTSKLTWTVELDASQEKELAYAYKVYIHQ